ncbi:MAG: J domain-containing protein, partial [Campylobacter sp.]|nr:J domain-containing protein [Campylobacter sp.]
RQYDQYGDSMFGGQSFHDFSRANFGGNADINDILNQIFGNFGGAGRSSRGFGGFNSASFGGFDGFDQGFGQNLDIQARINISFELAVNGGDYEFSINGEKIKIKIPAGLNSGEKLRARNKGKSAGNYRGDLIITVNIEEDKEYKRDGDDLYKNLDLTLKTALFGDKIDVKTFKKDVSIKIPPNTKNGQKIRLKGYGVKNRKSNIYGDMYLVTNIILPDIERIDPQLRDMLQSKL